jgi:hypothetical protein
MQIDELTKASEVHVLTWLKDSAQTWYYATKNDSLNWSIIETLNKYASAGTYEIRQVLIKRNDLDDLTIVDTALKEKGFDIDAVIANSNSDSINPELKGVDSITVSGNDGDAETNIIVTIVISVEDNESGVEKAFSYIKGPGGEITGSWGTLNEEKNKVTFTFTLDLELHLALIQLMILELQIMPAMKKYTQILKLVGCRLLILGVSLTKLQIIKLRI